MYIYLGETSVLGLLIAPTHKEMTDCVNVNLGIWLHIETIYSHTEC